MIRELTASARSIRRFNEAERVSEGQLRTLVDTARLCPCGGNQQPLRYRLIFEPDECASVFPHISWAGALPDWAGPAAGERPTGYICIISHAEHGTTVGIAGQTIQLAAFEMGLGCCMLGAIRRNLIHQELGLPEDMKINLLLALGKPAEAVVLEDARTGQDLAYYRSADGTHHVPKLVLEDVLIK